MDSGIGVEEGVTLNCVMQPVLRYKGNCVFRCLRLNTDTDGRKFCSVLTTNPVETMV